MRTLRVYVGEGFKAHDYVRNQVRLGFIDGATILAADGFWRAPDGEVFDEHSHVIVYVVPADPGESANLIFDARRQAGATGEQSIMVEDSEGRVTFHKAFLT